MAENILFVNSCIRGKNVSRTYKLSDFFIKKYMESKKDCVLKEIILDELNLKPFNSDMIERRNIEVSERKTDELISLAIEFAKFDTIIVATPYWDLSFPSMLRVFYEHISVSGITFKYEKDGTPKGLCKAKKALYITTSGGYMGDNNYGYEYTKELFNFIGIKNTYILKAEGLDIEENNADDIIDKAIKEAEVLGEKF